MNYVHVTNNAVDYGPGPLPSGWGLVSGLSALSPKELAGLGFLPVAEEAAAPGPWQIQAAPVLRIEADRAVIYRGAEPMSEAQIIAALSDAVQAHMDAQARAMGYDDIKTAVTYADEPAVAQFQAEGQALRAWRSLVWAACYQMLAAVQTGVEPMPESVEAFVAGLPPLDAASMQT